MAFDSARGKVVLFGGSSPSQLLRDTWEWDGTSWQLVNTGGPAARWGAAMFYDPTRNVCVLTCGGVYQPGAVYNDTWEWNGATWSQRVTPGPTPRLYTRASFDVARSRGVLAQGCGQNCSTIVWDTWEFASLSWVLANAEVTKFMVALAYDEATATMRGFNNVGGISQIQAQRWNGTAWILEPAAGPIARNNPDAAPLGQSGQAILFGGNSSTDVLGDTWVYRVPTLVTAAPQDVSACTTASTGFSVTVRGAGPFTYQWRKNTVAINTVANPSAATATLTLTNVGPADVASYDCIVTNACGSVTSTAASLTLAGKCSVADIAGTDSGPIQCGDSTVDGTDFIAFINSFGIGDATIDPLADVAGGGDTGEDPDGTIDGNDFIAFINAFAIGC
jgi:hypothetical protein